MTSTTEQRSTTTTSATSDDDASGTTNTSAPAPPAPPPAPPPPPPPGYHGVAPSTTSAAGPQHKAPPTPRSRLRRLQWVKIPAGRVAAAGSGRNVWNEVGATSSPPGLDFAEMEELFRVSESVNGVVRRPHCSDSPSDDVSTVVDKHQRNRDEVPHCTRRPAAFTPFDSLI